jgi:hypothetical protein
MVRLEHTDYRMESRPAARESSPVAASRAAVAAVVLLQFAWAPIAMAFVLIGVTSPGATPGVVVLAVILGAAALHAKLSGRPFQLTPVSIRS